MNKDDFSAKDFQDFCDSNSQSPSKNLDNTILNYVAEDLRPSGFHCYFKLFSVHAFVGVLTMLFCPQFGLSLTNNYELFHYFHLTFGMAICTALCAGIFMGTGALVAGFVLNSNEIKVIRQKAFLTYLSIASLFALIFITLETSTTDTEKQIWGVSAALVGYLLFQTSRSLKQKFVLKA
jgi:hypothetical protein